MDSYLQSLIDQSFCKPKTSLYDMSDYKLKTFNRMVGRKTDERETKIKSRQQTNHNNSSSNHEYNLRNERVNSSLVQSKTQTQTNQNGVDGNKKTNNPKVYIIIDCRWSISFHKKRRRS